MLFLSSSYSFRTHLRPSSLCPRWFITRLSLSLSAVVGVLGVASLFMELLPSLNNGIAKKFSPMVSNSIAGEGISERKMRLQGTKKCTENGRDDTLKGQNSREIYHFGVVLSHIPFEKSLQFLNGHFSASGTRIRKGREMAMLDYCSVLHVHYPSV